MFLNIRNSHHPPSFNQTSCLSILRNLDHLPQFNQISCLLILRNSDYPVPLYSIRHLIYQFYKNSNNLYSPFSQTSCMKIFRNSDNRRISSDLLLDNLQDFGPSPHLVRLPFYHFSGIQTIPKNLIRFLVCWFLGTRTIPPFSQTSCLSDFWNLEHPHLQI